MTTLKERIEKLPEVRREKVLERAKALIAEETRLRDQRDESKKDTGGSRTKHGPSRQPPPVEICPLAQ